MLELSDDVDDASETANVAELDELAEMDIVDDLMCVVLGMVFIEADDDDNVEPDEAETQIVVVDNEDLELMRLIVGVWQSLIIDVCDIDDAEEILLSANELVARLVNDTGEMEDELDLVRDEIEQTEL